MCTAFPLFAIFTILSIEMPGEPCAFRDNLDYNASTYKTIYGVPDINTCCRFCKKDNACVKFTYEENDQNNNNRRECFLKLRDASKEATVGFMSSPGYMRACSCEKGTR